MRLLEKSARGILNPEQLSHLWKGIDLVGDIAILKTPRELGCSRFQIAENLLRIAPYVKVVLGQVGPVESQFRTRRLEWLAGEKRTETTHREFECQFKVDLDEVYFSPRLGHEHKRIADLVVPGECVMNFFAGVGSFSIVIAKHAMASRIYSLDLNPAAVRYHAMNNAINRVRDAIDLICGDASIIASTTLVGRADRVLLPLPDLAVASLPTATRALRGGHGIVHCYVFVDAPSRKEAGGNALREVGAVLDPMRVPRKNMQAHVVRSVGPCRYQVCVDIVT